MGKYILKRVFIEQFYKIMLNLYVFGIENYKFYINFLCEIDMKILLDFFIGNF